MNKKSIMSIITASVIFAGCSSSSDPVPAADSQGGQQTPQNDASLADAKETIESGLFTGDDKTDVSSFWDCSISSDGGSTQQIDLRFFKDFTGFAGAGFMDWSVDEDGNVTLDFGTSFTTFTNVIMTRKFYSAKTGSGENVNCDIAGADRFIQDDGEDDLTGQRTLENFLLKKSTDGSTPEWSCTESIDNEVMATHSIQYLESGIGLYDGVAMDWFVDEQGVLNMVVDTTTTPVDIQETVENDNGTRTFSGSFYASTFSCTTAT